MSEPVREMLNSILDRQRQALLDGRRPTIELLLDGSPFEDDGEAQLDLLYNEVVVLEELGEDPVLEDYVSRYPHLAEDLRLHFEIHQAVNGALLDATDAPQGVDTWPEAVARPQPPGTRLGDYEIIQQIGQGGMGVVYRAHHSRLHRDVALKLFQPGRLPTRRETLRFQAEAESMARLTHPNIVQIFEVGETDGWPFLALELAEKGTLAQKLHQTLLTHRDAASLVETLARAIQHAHEHKVIHRDLKPANILFDRAGTPKITDFGLAKVLDDDGQSARDATRTGEPIGTPRYMSPEQASGQHDQIGPRTDVYSLGTLLYECLTGQAPFVAPSVIETLQKIQSEEPLPPRRLQRSIPRDLETICLHCLQKQPERRYQSALNLAEDLRRYLQGEPIQARPVSHWERTWKWCRRRPAHAALIAITMMLSFAALAVTAVGRQVERRRIDRLRSEVAELVHDGQILLEQNEFEMAYGRFHEAWMTVQAEPALADHQPGVGGWLDHSRRAVNKEQWKQRVPPREFDERRDVALLESLLLDPLPDQPMAAAHDAIHAAMELTLRQDPAWQFERERLTLLEAELIARDGSAAQALDHLDSTHEFASRLFHQRRAAYLTQLGRESEAKEAVEQATTFPPDESATLLMNGMNHVRQREFQRGLVDLEKLLNIEPEHYPARLFQAICFLNLKRPAEARVALTACIAQRPRLYWNYYFRAMANSEIGDRKSAASDLARVLEMNPSETVRISTQRRLTEVEAASTIKPSAAFSAN